MSNAAARATRCAAALSLCVASAGCRASAHPATPAASRPTADDCLERPDPTPTRTLQAIFRRADVTTYGGPPAARWVDRAVPHPDDRAKVAEMRSAGLSWIDGAPDAACRDRRQVAFLADHATFGGIDDELRDAAARLGPDDPAWSAAPTAAVRVAEALPTEAARARFRRAIVLRHPDPEVRAAMLFDEMRRQWDAGDDARVAEIHGVLSRAPYDRTSVAQFLSPYDPNHPLAVGRTLPEFSAPRLDGDGRIGPADLDGEINLLVLWGTHCPPCVEGMPKLHEIAAAHPELHIVSIAWGDSPAEVRSFRARFPMPWTHGYLDEAAPLGALVDAFGWGHIPQYILVDASGTILAGPPRLDLDGVREHLGG